MFHMLKLKYMLPFLFLSLVGCGSGTADVDDWVDNSSQ